MLRRLRQCYFSIDKSISSSFSKVLLELISVSFQHSFIFTVLTHSVITDNCYSTSLLNFEKHAFSRDLNVLFRFLVDSDTGNSYAVLLPWKYGD